MQIHFFKYQGTGNDFIMIDNRSLFFPKENLNLIHSLCDRNFGVGSDGLILIENCDHYDFKMVYYNADGSETFCGNGGRCAVAFANHLGVIKDTTNFLAYDGEHFATITNGIVSLQMIDVQEIHQKPNAVFAYTGTQHHVELVEDLENYPVFEQGRKIRYSYDAPGSNVNFVQKINAHTFRVRTYEKGVENETLACGTGVTAVAIAMHKIGETKAKEVSLPVQGGVLSVSFEPNEDIYTNVYLKGPATLVYEGTYNS